MVDRTRNDLLDFVDTADVGLHWVSSDSIIVWANPACYESLGYSADEYIGHVIDEFHVDQAAIDDIRRRLRAGERLHNYEAQLRCKDGSSRQMLITSSVKFDDTGKFLHTRCFTVDISGPRSRARSRSTDIQLEALNREVERLSVLASRERGLVEAILQHSPHGILVSDLKGKLTLQNKAAEKIWAGSASAEDIAGWSKYHAFHTDGRAYEGGDWAMAQALRHQEVVQPREVQIQRFDGTRGILLGGAAPIFAPDGQITGAVSVFADVTEFKRQEGELRIAAERYFTTLNSIADAVIATDAIGKITFINPVAEALTGFQLADAQGRPLAEVFRIVDGASGAELPSPLQVITQGKSARLRDHTQLIARDGTRRDIDESGAPIYDARRELAGVVLVFRDVTEKRREESRRRFIADAKSLLSSSLDYSVTLASVAKLSVPTIADWCAVDIAEANGTVERLALVHVDPAKLRWAEEVFTRYRSPGSHATFDVIHSGRPQLHTDLSDALLQSMAVDEVHLQLLRQLGLTSLMIVPLCHAGRTLGAITFGSTGPNNKFDAMDLSLVEELSSVAALAVENARLYREAQQANRAKDEFLATVSHELRTPLNAMLGWAYMLRTAKLSDEKRSRALETIERNARAQSQLVEDLLDVSRITSGKLRLEARAVDLGTIIEIGVDAVRLAADSKEVRIQLLLEDDARLATGDPDRLQQVVGNLLSNAVKFNDRGGLVTVELSRVASQAEIRVSDTGEGIDAGFLPQIFERFKQSDAKSTRSHGGLGLGLAIVKHLVELHGGTVTASSAGVRQGASFRVRLPLAAVEARSTAPLVAAPSSIVVTALEGLRILVVDDEHDARTLVMGILEAHGAEVVTASSVAEALREVSESAPDVIVSDIGMPEEDGYSLIRKLRQLTKHRPRPIPAVALTAFARSEDRTRAMLAGFHSHVAKPVEPDELLAVVATLVGRTDDAWSS
jgi:PAS domain S-box-containing protein